MQALALSYVRDIISAGEAVDLSNGGCLKEVLESPFLCRSFTSTAFLATLHASKMFEQVVPEMKELVQDLRARGWRVIIVTASPKWIVEPGARWLGLTSEDVIGIEVCRRS